MVCSVGIATFSQVLLKKSAAKTYTSPIKEYLNPYVITGYGLLFASMLLPIFAQKLGLGNKEVPVFEAAGPAIVMVLSFFFFRERITKRKIIGNVIIFIGILVFYLQF